MRRDWLNAFVPVIKLLSEAEQVLGSKMNNRFHSEKSSNISASNLNTERAYKRSAALEVQPKTRHLRTLSKQLENNRYAFTSETTKIRS